MEYMTQSEIKLFNNDIFDSLPDETEVTYKEQNSHNLILKLEGLGKRPMHRSTPGLKTMDRIDDSDLTSLQPKLNELAQHIDSMKHKYGVFTVPTDLSSIEDDGNLI